MGFLLNDMPAAAHNQWYERLITVVKHNICIREGTKVGGGGLTHSLSLSLSPTAHQFAIILNLLHALMTKPISCARVYPTIWFVGGGKKTEKKKNQINDTLISQCHFLYCCWFSFYLVGVGRGVVFQSNPFIHAAAEQISLVQSR